MKGPLDNGQRKSPYQGLTPYDEADAAFFFGREKETKLITASFFASPLTVLYGASGVGKSSILRAGVVKNLRARRDLLPIIFSRWQSDPLRELKISIAQSILPLVAKRLRTRKNLKGTIYQIEKLADGHSPKRLPRIEAHVGGPLDDFIKECSKLIGRRLMIILDQFEEYSLYHPENDRFAEQLPRAINISDLSVSFLLSLREDAVAQLDRFEGRIPTLFNNFRRIDHLDRHAARRAITEPVTRYNELHKGRSSPVSIETELVDQVLDQVGTGQVIVGPAAGAISTTLIRPESEGRIETPYLQLVMTRLWNQEFNQGSSVLRVVTLSQLGGAQRIVLTHLDAVMAKFSDYEKELAAKVFNQLVTPSGTKIAHLVRDLADYAGVIADDLRPLLADLSSGNDRILRPVAPLPEFPDEPRYEIFHDRLGPAILDWRSRYLHDQELLESNRREAEQRRFSQDYVDRLMSKLYPEELKLAAEVFKFLVTPSGVKVAQRLQDLADYLNVSTSNLSPVLDKLSGTEDGILTHLTKHERERYEIRHDALASAVLDWRARYLQDVATRETEIRKMAPKPISAQRTGALSPPYRTINGALRRGRVVPFIGLGASLSSRPRGETWQIESDFLPTGAELARFLATLASFPYEDEWERTDLALVASYVEEMAGRRILLEEVHKVLDRQFQPTSLHRYLAEVAKNSPMLLVTSNYDTMIEQAFDDAIVKYDVVTNVNGRDREDLRGAMLWWQSGKSEPELVSPNELTIDLGSRSVIYKIYGSIDRRGIEQTTLIITEFDYLELYARGFQFPPLFVHQLFSRNALFLGWPFHSWINRFLVQGIMPARQERPAAWSLLFNPSQLQMAFSRARAIHIYDEDLADFVEHMRH